MARKLRYEYLPKERVLALDPIRQGFGYVVLENEVVQLIDWGVSLCRRANHASCADAVYKLICRYKPTAIVFEDGELAVSSRRAAISAFLANIGDVLMSASVIVNSYSMNRVRELFAESNAHTKQQIAELLVVRFPELTPKLPKPRQLWESEDPRMAIFDALALALVDFEQRLSSSSGS